MGPDLWELFEEGKQDDEIAAIIRLGHSAVIPKGVRVVTQFSEIVTVRLKRANIPNVSGAPEVASMIAGDLYLGPDVELESAELSSDTLLPTDERRPQDESATGRGIVVGAVDWGFDFAHPDFRHRDGTTRILALWDQRGGKRPDSPKPFGYGVVHDREAINRALKEKDPYQALHYHPADADTGIGSHGTHVVSIAAGTGGERRPEGIAPEADLVLVHNAPFDEEESGKLGDSVTLLEGLDFIARTAGDRPWVVNTSLGRHGEQHDGSTLIEQGFDAAVTGAPGRAICMSAGNYFDKRIHASGQLRPTQSRTFVWEINQGPNPTDNNQLEVWYSWQDKFEAAVRSPDGSIVTRAKIGDRAKLMVGGKEVGNVYHRGQEPNNLDNHIVIFLYKEAPAGAWEVTLIGDDVIDGRFHAWIEREVACPRCQSHFRAQDADPRSTTGTICNGRRTIAVGAFDNHDPEQRLGHFSSAGPSRDGRLKPDLCAPGVSVLAARSTPRDNHDGVSLVTRMSGTSMAAPHVTGTVALMFQAAPRKLRIEETHNLLLENTRRVAVPEEIPDRIGIGFLDVREAVEAARKVSGTSGVGFRQTVVQTPAPKARPQPQQAERVAKRFAGGEEERAPKRETTSAVAEAIAGWDVSEAQPGRQPCNCGKRIESEGITRDAIAAAAIASSDAERHSRESIESEDLIPVAGDCSIVAVDCLFPPDSDLKKIRPKGKPEGDFADRTEGDRNVNLALQLFDYDINGYLPTKQRHGEALSKIREFIVNRSVQTTENIAVTVTGAASRTGTANYNQALSCKRAKCAAENLRSSLSFFRGLLERVQINPAGEGFTRATCRGSDCELGEWRSVLISVHAPGKPPKPIPVVDEGSKSYTIQCCSFHTRGVASALLGELLKRGLPQIPDFLKGKLASAIEKGLKKVIEQLRKQLPKLDLLFKDVGELLEIFPAEIIQETGTFEIAERDKPDARRIVLCYSGWGLRVLFPRQNIDEFLDDALDKLDFLKRLPDLAKKQFKEQVKKLIPDLLKTLIQPIESDTPGPVARFDLRHPQKIQVFQGSVQIGKGIWMPGQVNVEFDSAPWRRPDPVQRPAITACPDTDCNEAGVQTKVGDGKGLELFSISGGDFVPGSCVCAVRSAQGRESERVEKTLAELVEVADQIVRQPQGRRPPVTVLHEMLSYTGAADALTVPSTGHLLSAAEMFDSFAYAAPSRFREELEQQFEVVALPGASLRGGLQEADVLVRRGDGDNAHVSVIASPQLRDFESLRSVGMKAEISGSGRYAQVVETGARPHTREDQFARQITESSGRLPQNTLVLRMRQPLGARQSTESETAFETSAQSSLRPDVETVGKNRKNGGTAAHSGPAAADAESIGEGFGRRLLEDLLVLKLATPTPAPTVVKVEAPTGSATPSPQDFDSELSAEDELSCDHMDASQLSWPGASSGALDFMRRVYLRQTAAACRVRSFIADVPASELAEIENGVVARRDAAESCRRLLEAARASLASDSSASSVSRIGVLSGYRSASQQFTNWNRNFPRYYSETQADRTGLAGGEFGDAAAALLTRYISLRLAAPGFSLHNDGRAVDFLTVDHGHTLGADTHASNRAGWRRSWFFQWLTTNANSYGFFQNTSIDEPWHWEFRGTSETAPSQSVEAIRGRLPAPDTTELIAVSRDGESAEAFPPGHRLELSQTPLLASHRGTQPDLILRWNEAAESASTLDVVVHLHGYSSDRARMRLTNKEAYSGLDFSNPDNANAGPGRTSPTLGILPRGSYTGDQTGANPETYTFPALVRSTGIRDLISYSLQQFQTAGGVSGNLSTGRLILTAHSGGGLPLMRILGNNSPDEIHVFDALYWDASPLIAWVNTRISAEIQAWTPGKVRADGGLCILYRQRGTGKQSLRVQQALQQSVSQAPTDAQSVLQAAYRVLPTSVDHPEIPRRFGWRLLADITADLG
jgi:subtilisin family serine protease